MQQWQQGGARMRVGDAELFVRQGGTGPHVSLLHGFPTCSWDWSKVWDPLAQQRRLLALDLLGFGDSDKPARRYSFGDQADRLEALWQQLGVSSTFLVAHDYSATLALELLARGSAGSTKIEGVVFLNGALRGHLHRTRWIQRLLASPIGPWIAPRVGPAQFARSFSAIFATPPTPDELAQFWSSISRREGRQRTPALLHYIRDRRTHADRWEGALDAAAVPFTFVWGVRDPVSGQHVLDSVEHLGRTHPLQVGHYPQWEAPEATAQAILKATAGSAEQPRPVAEDES